MVRYSEELIEEIKNNNDIVDVISQYVTLKRSGRNFFGLCPFHKEKSPSFSVSPDKQIFHCFGCGVGGNVIHFTSKIENLGFKETIEILAERAGITLPTIQDEKENERLLLKKKVYEINKIAAEFYHNNLYLPTSKIAQEYIKKRKLDNKTLKMFSIGYSGTLDELYKELKKQGFSNEEILASSLVNKNEKGQYIDRFRKRLMIPIKDIKENVIAFGGRVLDDTKPKYINSPENIVYSKGRNLFAMNIAKKDCQEKLIIVEGYMDAISLYQRGITNVVASLGTALTEAQGRLMRKYTKKVIIGYDADGAGQSATLRGMEILQRLGCDIRILQIYDAKDPDEFVIKYGSARFNACVDKAISLIEFKVKNLKNSMNIESTSDKIKFLNEIVKILSDVDNDIEKEIYIEKISNEYGISKEAIYAQANKNKYKNSQGTKILEKTIPIKTLSKTEETSTISQATIKRENMVISLLINFESNVYEKIKDIISPNEFKEYKNKKIIEKLYEEFEKGNSNINNILDSFEEEEIINHITFIMAYDFEITDINKAITDVIYIYEKEKIIDYRNEILAKLENTGLEKEERIQLERELSNCILKLAKMK